MKEIHFTTLIVNEYISFHLIQQEQVWSITSSRIRIKTLYITLSLHLFMPTYNDQFEQICLIVILSGRVISFSG